MGKIYCLQTDATIQIPKTENLIGSGIDREEVLDLSGTVKVSLFVLALAVAALSACTTLENRRDMYFPQKVNGPYTRMLKDGIPKPQPVHGAAPKGMSDGKSVVR